MNFDAIYTEGFFEREGLFVREEGDKVVCLQELLFPLLGQSVRLALVQVPPGIVDPDKWGGGSCLWQSTGTCPSGHHLRSSFLLNFTGDGVLSEHDTQFTLTSFAGTTKTLPLPWMQGHYGRLAAATLVDVDRMRDALAPEDK